MTKNHIDIDDVAKMLGVERGEDFQIIGDLGPVYYFLEHDGLKKYNNNIGFVEEDDHTLVKLLTGEKEIVRRPWRPKLGQAYWYVSARKVGDDWCRKPAETKYVRSGLDLCLIAMGNCFPTEKAAKEAIPDIIKLYEDTRRMVEGEYEK